MYSEGNYYQVKIIYKPKGNITHEYQEFTTDLYYHEDYVHFYFNPKFIKFFRNEDGLKCNLEDYDYKYQLVNKVKREKCVYHFEDDKLKLDYPVMTNKRIMLENNYYNLPLLKKLFTSKKFK